MKRESVNVNAKVNVNVGQGGSRKRGADPPRYWLGLGSALIQSSARVRSRHVADSRAARA
jgi:hypothetical protein